MSPKTYATSQMFGVWTHLQQINLKSFLNQWFNFYFTQTEQAFLYSIRNILESSQSQMDLNTVHNGDIWGTRDVMAIGALEQD